MNRHRLRRRLRRLHMQLEACVGVLMALSDAIEAHQNLLNLRRAVSEMASGDAVLLLNREVSRHTSLAAVRFQDAHAGI